MTRRPLTNAINRVAGLELKSTALQTEEKSLSFELKAADTETNVIEGYAATFGGSPDSYGDIIQKGAFTKTLKERGTQIKFLWQHNWNELIGRIIDAKEDDKGLFIKVKISDTQRGREVMTLIKDQALDKMSIGYRTIQYDYDRDTSIRTLKEVQLFEVSAVTFPANESAVITGAKNQTVGADLTKGFADFVNVIVEEVKAGRTISEKTKTQIINAIGGLEAAHTSLKTLLDSVDGTDPEEDDEEEKRQQAEQERKEREAIELADLIKSFTEKTKTFASTT
jgi:uncharacterized protein